MSSEAATTEAPAKPNWVRPRERVETRRVLVDAARNLIARDGVKALTLSAVAAEAGFARATIYGYFSGKKELLAAINAEAPAVDATVEPNKTDAAPPEPVALATPPEEQSAETTQAEPDVVAPSEDVAEVAVPPAEAALEPATPVEPAPIEETSATVLPEPCEPEPVEASPEALPSDSVAVEAAEATEFSASPEERRRLQAAHLDEIAKRLVLPESAHREGTDATIARLDTRVRVLERSLANLESRHNAAATETDKKFKPVCDNVEQLRARADAADSRELQALSELRLSVHDLTTKLAGSDPAPRGAVSGALSWPLANPDPEPQSDDQLIAEAPNDALSSDEDSAGDNSRHAYLSALRNIANEGARHAAEQESQRDAEQRIRRKRMLVAAGVAAVCLAAIGVLFKLHPGPQGISAAQSKVPSPPLSQTAPRHSLTDQRAPLDRLSALARSGDPKAELVIGLKYLAGDGIGADDTEAARWLERAALKGEPVAENALGSLYQSGRGVKLDVGQAMHWYESAAMLGDRHAMSNLAVLYASGVAGTKNLAEAARWFQRSADLGYVDAQFNLAVLFERGDGVPQSLLDAYKWYAIAAAAGDQVAKTRADAIATQVSAEELQAAEHAVAEFKPLPLNIAANQVPTMAGVLATR